MIFLQRDANGVADVRFSGDSARILKDGEIVADWTTGGVIAAVGQGDGYTLEILRNGVITQEALAIGIVVGAIGQSNMNGWFYGYTTVPAAPHTYMLGASGWTGVTGEGARTFSAILSQQLGVPVALVNSALGGTPLLEQNANPLGYWLADGPGTLYGDFVQRLAAPGGRAEFILWAQGEHDAATYTTDRATYQAGLLAFLARLQNDVGPSLIGVAELGGVDETAGYGTETGFGEIRAAQQAVDALLENLFIGTRTLGLDRADFVHLNRVSYAFQAADMARALLAQLGLPSGFGDIAGTQADETIAGTDGADRIDALGGNDVVQAGPGADIADGGDGDDVIDGGEGNDLLRGAAGVDRLTGGDGDDMMSAGDGDDIAEGGGGNDELWGDAGDDLLFGGDGADVLNGVLGNDRLDGGAGADRMEGGAGADTYVVSDAGDLVIELADAGIDTIEAGMTITLAALANVENVRLTGSAAANATGNGAANRLEGNSAANILSGLGGDDWLDGRGGADQLLGGNGDDSYVVDQGGVVVVEQPGGGRDTVYSSISIAVPAHVERLLLTGDADIDATGGDDAEEIVGNAGANLIDGRGGADLMSGGAGDDTYFVDTEADIIVEAAGAAGGTDTVVSSVSYALSQDIEYLALTGTGNTDGTGNALANLIAGNSGANRLDGGDGDDVIVGGAGDDRLAGGAGSDVAVLSSLRAAVVVRARADGSFLVTGPDGTDILVDIESIRFVDGSVYDPALLARIDSSASADADNLVGTAAADVIDGLDGDDRITGLGGNDTLAGGRGNDWLDGGTGVDSLRGGAGDDSYVVDAAADGVVENAGEGTDTVIAGMTRTLEANVENLVLSGTATINGTGNALDNRLIGNVAANTLSGAAGADTLDGGSGADALYGGDGSDTYLVDNAGDVIVEYLGTGAAQTGYDTVRSTVSHMLAANVENLVLEGNADIGATGNALANTLTGNTGANMLDGRAGADTMIGGAGNDSYAVDAASDAVIEDAEGGNDTIITALTNYTLAANVENLVFAGVAAANLNGNLLANRLTGGAGVDTLRGNGGADVLDGGASADVMAGGDGDDSYRVDDAGDVILEFHGTGPVQTGIDGVVATVSYILSANIENIVLDGAADIDATGNISNNLMTGNSGANVLDGGLGTDTMIGGAGDDRYFVERTGDLVVERGGEGIDAITATVGYVLPADVENLTLAGSLAINGAGNAAANRLTGNSGANVLLGGEGNDVLEGGGGTDILSGGAGADRFTLRSGQIDGLHIADFTSGLDHIDLVGFTQHATAAWRDGCLVVSDGGSEHNIVLSGVVALAAGDYSLLAPVIPGNAAPAIAAIDAMTATQDAAFSTTLPPTTVTDADAGDWLFLNAIQPDGSALPAWLSFDPATRSFSGTPGQGDVGTLTIRLIAADAGNLSALMDFVLTVEDVNDAPAAAAPIDPQPATEDQPFAFALPDTAFADIDPGDTLVYAATLADGSPLPPWLSFDPAIGGFGGTPANGDIGTLTVRVTASDTGGLSATTDFVLTVVSVNDAPTAAAPIAPQSASEDQPFSFVLPDDVLADADAGDTLSLSASLADGTPLPAWLTFDAATHSFSGTPADSDTGTLTVRVTARDSAAEEIAADFTLVVQPTNDGPAVIGVLPDQEATMGQAFSYALPAGLFVDIDPGDQLGLTVALADGATLPAWLHFDAAAAILHGTPAEGDAAVLALLVTATDLAGAVATIPMALALRTAPPLTLRGTAGADILTGGSGADTLIGYAGSDRLDGGTGADAMIGGDGDDIYVVDHAGDSIVEYNGAGPSQSGYDTVRSTISYALALNTEYLVLEEGAGINGTGNALINRITGNSGANILDGGGGSDILAGGAGDDMYLVDTAGDAILEHSGEGIDTVRAMTGYTLSANVETLSYVGAGAAVLIGNELANRITGGGGADILVGADGGDILDGGAGSDALYGGNGDDVYYVDSTGDSVTEYFGAGTAQSGNDTVHSTLTHTLSNWVEGLVLEGTADIAAIGNALNNALCGNSGANLLDGRAGNDRMTGGGGNDTYIVDSVTDLPVEAADGGIDLVRSSVSFTLGADIEDLEAVGSASLTLVGNTLSNRLTGGAGGDTLNAGAGADVLNGGAGADRMTGGDGDDVYYVDNAADIVTEYGGSGPVQTGTDTVRSAISYVLGANVENLALEGDIALSATGNGLANTLTGNGGANRIDGGLRSDTLTGGDGADTFVFSTAPYSTNVDQITDFTAGTDSIELDQHIFSGLDSGVLATGAFRAGGAAAEADDRLIYNPSTGVLIYDPDGLGGAGGVTFAILATGLALGAGDFLVV